jgi:hypothetical protein
MRFEDNNNEFGRPPEEAAGFDLTGKLVEWGLVSDTQQAQYVLIGVAVLALLVAAFFFFHSAGSSTPPPPPVS